MKVSVDLPSTLVESIITNFAEEFDSDEYENVVMWIDPKEAPQIKIEKGLMMANGEIKFNIMNPFKPE